MILISEFFFLFLFFLLSFDKSVFGGRKLKVLCVCVYVYFMWKTLGRTLYCAGIAKKRYQSTVMLIREEIIHTVYKQF